MRNVILVSAAFWAAIALTACTPVQVTTTTTAITTACQLSPVIAASASATVAVKADIAVACADEQTLAPVVTPLIPTK